MENIILELRSGEGGEDSKLLVSDMADLYQKVCRINDFEHKVEK